MRQFTRSDIEASFDRTVFLRGESYYRNDTVLEVGEPSDGVVTGRVQGSEKLPYFVRLILAEDGKHHMTGHCTCPVGEQCKHCVAVALTWLALKTKQESKLAADVELPYQITDWLGALEAGAPDPDMVTEGAKYRLFYILYVGTDSYGATRTKVRPVNRTILKSGAYGTESPVKATSIDNRQFSKHFNTFDRDLLTDLAKNGLREEWTKAEFTLDHRHGVRLLKSVLRSGRCRLANGEGPEVKEGPIRRGVITWEVDRRGQQSPRLEISGGGRTLPISPPWYVDERTGECGPIDCGLPDAMAYAILSAPSIAPEFAEQVRQVLPRLGVPAESLPHEPMAIERLAPLPVPQLRIDIEFCSLYRFDAWRRRDSEQIPVPFARLSFRYGEEVVVPSNHDEIRRVLKDRIQIITRDGEFERRAERALRNLGWTSPKYVYSISVPNGRGTHLCLAPNSPGDTAYLSQFRDFLRESVPNLRSEGWDVVSEGDFQMVSEDAVEWDIGVDADSTVDWFEFKLAVKIDGKEVPLRPILLQLLKPEAPTLDPYGRRTKTPAPNQDRFVTLPGGVIVQLSPERIRKILRPLIELFGEVIEWPEELKLPKSRLTESEELAKSVEEAGLAWKSPPELQAISERLREFSHLAPLPEPEGFVATLREYQQEGLAWLQFLREYGFGGILADDMGLGKTVQVLAHIQMEKLAGRLDRPCLVVAPTSTLPNWRREAERFVPGLNVLVYHGSKRGELAAAISGVDIVVTNYALLARDKSDLAKEHYHLVVLDEAQNIKNAATAASKAARDLRARHRLCLSGTPIENHLDELWSLFHFLMPGFLDSATRFRQRFRTPIEQKGDEAARSALARRVRPFMLRRTKQQVVTELPPKTEILETVELGESQRELYETLRLAMDDRVRGLLAEQGLARSRIQVLDALLKLRQVCCDPRLVKLPAARSVSESAKLDRLIEMTSVLLEDGRKILLFSQFTSMLDLIEERLRALDINWVRITGDTKDRDTPVRQFEGGEVPLFLISLKAGGTGLNLVAADTVIHYDPWWNPAVENQATDRAYRIGQDKPVMVYKLVVAGTVEEKILELQRRKGDLAASLLSESERSESILDADELQWLLSK